MQGDRIGFAGGMNLYNYVGSDPVNNIDPMGMKAPEPCTGSLLCSGVNNVITIGGHWEQVKDHSPSYTDADGAIVVTGHRIWVSDTIDWGSLWSGMGYDGLGRDRSVADRQEGNLKSHHFCKEKAGLLWKQWLRRCARSKLGWSLQAT